MTAGPYDPPSTLTESDPARRARKVRKREVKLGVLDPAMRYKALFATLKMEMDFLDLADKKARFALVIMSVLNAVAVLLAVRGGKDVIPREGMWGAVVQLEFACYIAATVYYVVTAIEALRPRGKATRPKGPLPTEVTPGDSMRILFHVDIAQRERPDYIRMWQEVRFDNLITELGEQLHIVAQINARKYAALGRLYQGVTLMTAMLTVTLLTVAAWKVFGG